MAVGKQIEYLLVETLNRYTGKKISVVIAKKLAKKYFNSQNINLSFADYKVGEKKLPFNIVKSFKGALLDNLIYVLRLIILFQYLEVVYRVLDLQIV